MTMRPLASYRLRPSAASRRVPHTGVGRESRQQQPMPGDLLQKLMNVHLTVTMVGEQPKSLTTLLPDEVDANALRVVLKLFPL